MESWKNKQYSNRHFCALTERTRPF